MKQTMKNGQILEFETLKERDERLQATAETIYSICTNGSLSILDYERMKTLLDGMVYNRTLIRDQSNI